MKKFIYYLIILLTSTLAFSGCNKVDEDERILRQHAIDISDFTMYKGSPEGGVKIQFNNLKKGELVEKYLSSVYTPDEYSNTTFQFNGNKLTYVESREYNKGIQVISDYKIEKDSLYISIVNSTDNSKYLQFVALVDTDNSLYRRKGLISYPNPNYDPENPEQPKFKQEFGFTRVDMNTALDLAGYSTIEDLTNPEDTIIWCNVIYPFN